MANNKLPLLIKGYFSDENGNSSTLGAIAANTEWSQALETQRGDMVAVDIMRTADNKAFYPASGGISHLCTLQIGGMSVIESAVLMLFEPISTPRSYEILRLRQAGGQTLNFALKVVDPAYVGGAIVHVYFDNPYANQEVISARNSDKLKQRFMDITGTFVSGTKGQEFKFNLPRNMGNIVGIQLIAESRSDNTGLDTGIMTVQVNGIDIFQTVSMQLGMAYCGRPSLIFPIGIEGGVNGKISVDTSASAAGTDMSAGIRVYFDDKFSLPESYSCN